MAIIKCENHSSLPKVDHWALISSRTIVVPGYDKGDPDDRMGIMVYTAYTTKEELNTEIERLIRRNELKDYTLLFVKVPNVNVDIQVDIT